MARSRNYNLDFYRGFAAIWIVFIHCCFWSGDGYVPLNVKSLSLFIDVPLFMFISGMTYNYSNKKITSKDEIVGIYFSKDIENIVPEELSLLCDRDFEKLFKLKYGLDIVFIDYINLITEGAVGENTTTKLGYIASKLKQLAMDENICVVLLAQAKRDTDKENKNKAKFEKVENGDIQDSARIEQYSNTILSIYRNLKLDNKVARKILAEEGKIDYNYKNPDENPGVATITINKDRLGN